MLHIPVKSSNIKSIGYNAATMELEIDFHDGGIYRAKNVPAEKHAQFMAAKSKGSYFAAQLKHKYKFEKAGK